MRNSQLLATRVLPVRFWAGGVLLLLWLVLAYVLAGCLAMPWMDSWCYFAPGILSRQAFSLTMPLLDGYRGADTTWAIHWPGAPLLYSCVGPVLRHWPLTYPGVIIGLWLGLAWAARALMCRFTREPAALWGVMAAVLLDRALLTIAGDRRPEIVAALAVMCWLVIVGRCREPALRPGAGSLFLLAFFAFAAALSHPVTMACMAGFAALGLAGLLLGRLSAPLVLAHFGGLASGLGVFAGRLHLLPHAKEQFMDHAATAQSAGLHFSPWLAAVGLYYPSPSGVIIVGLAVVYGAALLLRGRSGQVTARDGFMPRLTAVTFFGLLAACHLFPNPLYVAILIPVASVLAVTACMDLARWLAGRCHIPPAWAVAMALVLLIGGDAAYWVQRVVLFARLGCPNLSSDLARWYGSLPAGAHHVLIPDHLWEAGAMDGGHEVAFVTPPYTVSPGVRLAYERQVLSKLTTGDLVIVDLAAKDSPAQLQPWLAGSWPLIMKNERSLPSSSFWGYRFEVYRKP